MTSEQKRKQIIATFGAYSKRLETLYDDFVKKLSALAIKSHVSVKAMLEESPLYHFNDYPELRQELNSIFNDYVQKEMLCYKAGISDGVSLAFSHDAGVLKGFSVLSDKAVRQVCETASETFLRTRLHTREGLNLSHLVWNYASQAKSEFEVAISNIISDGLKEGVSAIELARLARQYLNNPDMMYRRYHRTIIDANGNKRDIVRWRRRIVDENGKVRFVEEPLEKVGMGHYRSARKNSERLMRTEINSAYHHANYERWQMEPFVIGIQIDLSPQHPEPDMCDDLAGQYPKDFLFAGWHPQCLCMANPITIQGDEKREFYRRLAAGEDMSDYQSPNRIKDVPDGFKSYVDKYHDAMVSAAEHGKLGYVWRDNAKYWRGQFSREELERMGFNTISSKERILQAARERHAQRTPEQVKNIQARWDKHRKDYYNGLVHDLLGEKYLTDINSKDLYERFYKIRVAIQEHKSPKEVSKIFDRFKQGYQTKLAWTNRKVAMNVLSVAQTLGYHETKNAAVLLQSALKAQKFDDAVSLAKSLAKQVASINEKANEWSTYIPNVKNHLKSLSTSDLEAVYKSVKDKVTYFSAKYGSDYVKLVDKYNYEAIDYLGGNKYGVQQKYPKTWKISQQAYLKLADEAKVNAQWKGIETILSELKAFDTKSPIIKDYVSELNKLTVTKQDLGKAQDIAAKAEQKKNALLREKSLRAKGNVASSGEVQLASVSKDEALRLIEKFENDYSERMDDLLRGMTENVWKQLSKEERLVVTKYTQTYSYLNEPLREKVYQGMRGWKEFQNDMPILTRVLDKMQMPENCVVRRGVGDYPIKALGKNLSNVKVGDEFIDGAFLSTSVTTTGGFSETYNLVIVVPKGARGIYAEPFSHYTDHLKFDFKTNALWSGTTKEPMRHEREWIGQRGSKFRVIKKDGTTIYLQMIGQKYNQTTDYRSFFDY